MTDDDQKRKSGLRHLSSDHQRQSMEKLSLQVPAQEEQPQQRSSSFSSSSFVNTHLSLTKVVRRYHPSVRLKEVDIKIPLSFYLGRVPLGCISPRIQQAETRSILCLLPALFGDIGPLLVHTSYSCGRVLGTATTTGRHTRISECFSIYNRTRTVGSLLRKPFIVGFIRATTPLDHFARCVVTTERNDPYTLFRRVSREVNDHTIPGTRFVRSVEGGGQPVRSGHTGDPFFGCERTPVC